MTDQLAIVFTPEKLARFKRAYEKHKDEAVFVFDGHEFLPSYAKYLIEYLEGRIVRV